MNKQGNLNEFFNVASGSGTYAPRKRQVYSSKRLQQVVSEFRSEKAKLNKGRSPSPAVSEGSTGSVVDEHADGEPVRKRRKTGAKGKGKARAEVGDSTGKKAFGQRRGRGRGTKTAPGRKKRTTASADGEDGEDEYVGDTGDVVGFVPELRPRPKPKPAYKGNVGSDSDAADNT